jgi:predicted nucleic acid-binding protein
MGLLGILLQARQRLLVPSIAVLLDRLEKDARFWISPSLRTAILLAAGE